LNKSIQTTFRPTKIAYSFIFILFFGSNCPCFAQITATDSDFNAIWRSVETLIGPPKEEAARFFNLHNAPPDALLAQAENYILSYKNDSAVQISNLMIHTLKQQNQLESPLGLKTQLVLARALEHNQADSISQRLLLHVKQNCQKEGPWDTYIKCCLALALLEENIGRPAQCLEHLNDAKAAIDREGLHTYYPSYAMRACSYHRVLIQNRDSAVYYAKEILRTAPIHQMVLEEAWGNMLLASLLSSPNDPEFLKHFQASAKLFITIEDYTGLSYAFGAISSSYSHAGDLSTAMAYNDSTIVAAQKSIAAGNKWNHALFGAYQFRADLFRQMERHDSAWHYLQKGYETELTFVRESESAKALEIDARYLNEKKARQIQEQTKAIRFEQRMKKMLLLIVGIVFLLALGLAVGLVRYIRGMRELAEKNSIIEQQAEQLRSLDSAKSRFFANISHELRTPLTLLLGAISTIKKENHLTEKQQQLVLLANRGGEELGRLIHEILDLGKLESGKMAANREPVRVAAFFSTYFAQFESLAERKKIRFTFETDIDEDTTALLDKEKCRQMVYNLLSNAFKFTHAGGSVSGALHIDGGMLQLRVADTGTGIHPDDLPHIFERYFQTNQVNATAQGGTGIGLALCREYARFLDGEITAQSRLGEGSEFVIRFPVALTESAPALPETGEGLADEVLPAAAGSGGLSPAQAVSLGSAVRAKPAILVVEDNFELQAYLRTVLEGEYRVITADNGQVALDVLSSASDIQLIISDLMMPVMDGYQLLEALKSNDATRHIPTIMLTARAEARDRLKALRIGVDDYLTKPFDEEELLVRIENLLKNKAARLEETATEPTAEKAAPVLSAADRDWLENFEEHVRKNLASDLLTVPELAHHCLMSESTLLRQLKRLTGLTPQQYLMELRLDKARQLLEAHSRLPLAKIASQAGYSDVRSFSRSFRQRFGKLPSELTAA
jgi:signal transduction histidine kinase/CheY-like chemotaxis protein